MTAFARSETRTEAGMLTWEIRSLNHRYLEVNFRLPDNFLCLEMALREQLKARLQRGKIEINLRYQTTFSASNSYQLNQNLLDDLLIARQQIKAQINESLAPVDALELLRWPEILRPSAAAWENLQPVALTAFEQTLTQVMQMRQNEGKSIYDLLQHRLQAMLDEVSKVRAELPQIIQLQRAKLLQRLQEAQLALDNNRLEQEMVMFAQKIDVAEELDRLTTHIKETQRTLDSSPAQGRRLDFLAQELHREANTLAAKSVNSATTLAAVQLKVLIEQLREQVQNIE